MLLFAHQLIGFSSPTRLKVQRNKDTPASAPHNAWTDDCGSWQQTQTTCPLKFNR